MIKKLFVALPGPLPVRVLEAIIILLILLVGLLVLFEWAGTLLDSGGVVGN